MSAGRNKPMPNNTLVSSTDERNDDKSVINTSIFPILTNNSLPPYTITFYVLRIAADINETWSIQAIFENSMKFNFKAIKSLKNSKVNLLDLTVNVENDIHLE